MSDRIEEIKNVKCDTCKKKSKVGFQINNNKLCPVCFGKFIKNNYKIIPRFKCNNKSLKEASIEYEIYKNKIGDYYG